MTEQEELEKVMRLLFEAGALLRHIRSCRMATTSPTCCWLRNGEMQDSDWYSVEELIEEWEVIFGEDGE